MELLETVCAVISKNKNRTEPIRPDDRLKEDLGIDSFDTLMIGCDLEDELKITIDPDEIKGLVVVGDIVERLRRKLSLPRSA